MVSYNVLLADLEFFYFVYFLNQKYLKMHLLCVFVCMCSFKCLLHWCKAGAYNFFLVREFTISCVQFFLCGTVRVCYRRRTVSFFFVRKTPAAFDIYGFDTVLGRHVVL